MLNKNRSNQKGQGVVEYILVTALAALATVAVFKSFRTDIASAYRKAGQSLVQGVEESSSGEAQP